MTFPVRLFIRTRETARQLAHMQSGRENAVDLSNAQRA